MASSSVNKLLVFFNLDMETNPDMAVFSSLCPDSPEINDTTVALFTLLENKSICSLVKLSWEGKVTELRDKNSVKNLQQRKCPCGARVPSYDRISKKFVKFKKRGPKTPNAYIKFTPPNPANSAPFYVRITNH